MVLQELALRDFCRRATYPAASLVKLVTASAALETGRLALGIAKPNGGQGTDVPAGPVHAWHQGRLLHLTNAQSGNHRESEAWALTVRESVTGQQPHELSFLSRLFGGVILHAQNKQIPIVLFSDQPCV